MAREKLERERKVRPGENAHTNTAKTESDPNLNNRFSWTCFFLLLQSCHSFCLQNALQIECCYFMRITLVCSMTAFIRNEWKMISKSVQVNAARRHATIAPRVRKCAKSSRYFIESIESRMRTGKTHTHHQARPERQTAWKEKWREGRRVREK